MIRTLLAVVVVETITTAAATTAITITTAIVVVTTTLLRLLLLFAFLLLIPLTKIRPRAVPSIQIQVHVLLPLRFCLHLGQRPSVVRSVAVDLLLDFLGQTVGVQQLQMLRCSRILQLQLRALRVELVSEVLYLVVNAAQRSHFC